MRNKHRLVNHAAGSPSLPRLRAGFVALEFILRKTPTRMVKPSFASRRNPALIAAAIR
jgi:hypothetical protein